MQENDDDLKNNFTDVYKTNAKNVITRGGLWEYNYGTWSIEFISANNKSTKVYFNDTGLFYRNEISGKLYKINYSSTTNI